MGFTLSPSVNVKEIDLSTIVPAVATSIAATVGKFAQGPCNTPVLITNQKELISMFGEPTSDVDVCKSWFTCSNFLAYGNKLYIVRATDADLARNAGLEITDATLGTIAIVNEIFVQNDEAIDSYTPAWTSADYKLALHAKYPGVYGNDIQVAVSNATDFATAEIIDGTTFLSEFEFTPTAMAEDNTTVATDWIGIAVLDADDTILEKHMVCTDTTAKDYNSNSQYVENWLQNYSDYIIGFEQAANTDEVDSIEATSLLGGLDGALISGDITTGYSYFANEEEIDVNLIIDSHVIDETATTTIQQYIADNVADSRKDCVGIFTVPYSDVTYGTAPGTATTNCTAYKVTLGRNSSYCAIYGNWKYQYDKYNDVYRWLPLSGDIAGIYARTDYDRDAWFAPAGLNRGQIKNVVKLAFNPNRAQRDILYQGQINPVVNFPSEGPVVWGQKTLQTKPSAFDRVDVRRLFIVLEKAISTASKYFLFEKNTAFTRGQLKGMIEPFLRTVQGRQGIHEFHVECSDINNTADVIDRNELVCDIYIQPTRTAEFISLNFIATRTGVDFNEFIGKVQY